MKRTPAYLALLGVALSGAGMPAYAVPTGLPSRRPTSSAPPATTEAPAPTTQAPPPVPTTRAPAPTTRVPAPTTRAPQVPTRIPITVRAPVTTDQPSTTPPVPSRILPPTAPPSATPAPSSSPVPTTELDAKALIGPAQCEDGRRIVPVWAANGTATELALRLRVDDSVSDLAVAPAGGRIALTPTIGDGLHPLAVLAGDQVLAELSTRADCADGRTDTVVASVACAGVTFTNRFPMAITIRWGDPRELQHTVEVPPAGVLTVPGVRPETMWVAQAPEFLRAGLERLPADCPATPPGAPAIASVAPTPSAVATSASRSPGRGTTVWAALAGAALGLAALGARALHSRVRR